jgi:DNA-binding transcriptional ArsR family regulator
MTGRALPDWKNRVLDEAIAIEMADFIKIAANPTRLRILWFLIGGERAVSEIEAETGLTQPTLSQQLSVLRASEIVTTRRVHKAIFYKVTDVRVAKLAQWLATIFSLTMRTESERTAGSGHSENAAVFALLSDAL